MVLKRDKELERKIARERIDELMKRSQIYKYTSYELAKRYVELAKKISMKYRVRMSREQKRSFCKKCMYPYRADRMRVRIKKRRVIVTCLNCKHSRRFQLKPKTSNIV
ncbi:MAG: ribonuclease P [Archaeoglobaceae archaeon]|nr:ribonuclease P [Archaeoglobaceae archaeon]MCX8151799.1 ribonuclease P [Archaeoglobaceae archaeon]MDW8013175.1 ribonuclease P [Archaeoglobaceae archaeon]